MHVALVRKTRNSLEDSAVKTFDRVTKGLNIRKVGGVSTERYIFPNGSEIVLVGMDKPDKLLSSEWDKIYVVQAEELKESDWEIAASRVTGRGAVVKHPQIYGDCNPSNARHWIRSRKSLRLINGSVKDNPELYDDEGNQTVEGARRIKLAEDMYTGVRRQRLLYGIWATAEGAVYDMFQPDIHIKDRPMSEFKQVFMAMDEGYTNPAVILCIGEDADGRAHVFREFYKTKQLQSVVVDQAIEWSKEFGNPLITCDEAAAGLIADLKSKGLRVVGAKGRTPDSTGKHIILDGIRAIQDRLKVQGDGLPRITVSPACSNTINELESYSWKKTAGNVDKDEPEKEYDHACFVAGTIILTKRGGVPIEKVTTDDYCWTPFGWSRVISAAQTGATASVKDYGAFVATPDHAIITQRGIIPLDELRYDDTLLLWKNYQKQWSLMEFLTGVIQMPSRKALAYIFGGLLCRVSDAKLVSCTAISGSFTTGKYLKAFTSTTGMVILQIMTLAIWSLSLPASIITSIRTLLTFVIWKKSGRLQSHGINQKRAAVGIKSMAKKFGKIIRLTKSNASAAEQHIRHPFLVAASSVISTVGCEPCENAETKTSENTPSADDQTAAQKAIVFNLATEHGMYFANGVLVSNCDALRYWVANRMNQSGFASAQGFVVGDSGGSLGLDLDLGTEWLDIGDFSA